MPKNETGYTLTVGPDAEGRYFDVAPGEDYEMPAPPVTVTDLEAAAAAALAKFGDDNLYASMKVADLRKALADRGLDTSGRRDDLLARLGASDEETVDDAPGDGDETNDNPPDPSGEDASSASTEGVTE